MNPLRPCTVLGPALCALGIGIGWMPPLAAQTAALSSQMQLQSSDAGTALAAAMSRLATNPRDLNALLAAGESALKLEDPRSAVGFFGRADDISPNNGRVKAGLGRSLLQLDQVGDGLRLLEQAGNLGYSDFNLLADRGLARDLTGNQAGAQEDYAAALKMKPGDDVVVRRYAVSLGIVGQLDQAEAKIQPLLYKSDRGAWRDRAFILAMNGKVQEAEQITAKVMPKPLADAIKPYIERMAMLSPGQRAAAVHLGQFPPGLVNMRIASTAVPVRSVETAPAAKPARNSSKPSQQVAMAEPQTVTLPPPPPPQDEPQPAARAAAAPSASTLNSPIDRVPTPVAAAPARSAPSAPVTTPRVAAAPAAPTPVSAPARQVAAPQPVPASATVPPAPRPAPASSSDRTLAEIMADIKVSDDERRPAVAPVNLAEIAQMQAAARKAKVAADAKAAKDAARKKAEEEAKAKAAAEKKRLADNPARYWVQIGVGRDKGALGFTLKRMKKEHSVLGKYDGWSADWGRTNRLVVGPFKNLDKAKAVEGELKKDGSDAFVWRSDAGEELDSVGG